MDKGLRKRLVIVDMMRASEALIFIDTAFMHFMEFSGDHCEGERQNVNAMTFLVSCVAEKINEMGERLDKIPD